MHFNKLTSRLSIIRARRGRIVLRHKRLENRSRRSRLRHWCKQLGNVRGSGRRNNAKRLGQRLRRLDRWGIGLRDRSWCQGWRQLRLPTVDAVVRFDAGARNRCGCGHRCRLSSGCSGWIRWDFTQIDLGHTFSNEGGIGQRIDGCLGCGRGFRCSGRHDWWDVVSGERWNVRKGWRRCCLWSVARRGRGLKPKKYY